MSKREFRYHSIEPEGLWTSEVFGPSDHRHIVQGVIGGWLGGRPRWATDLDGKFIYGLDAKGKEMKSAPKAHATRRHATKKGSMSADDRLFIGTFPTGISYADRAREKNGDYLRIAFLPFSSLALEWSPGRHPPELKRLVEEHAAKMRSRRGQDYPVSASGQTVRLGGHAIKKSPSQLDAEIAEILARYPYDDPSLRKKWMIDPSELHVGMRFDYFGQPYEIVKIGRDKDKTIQLAVRHTPRSGKDIFVEHKSFPLRQLYQQHMRPIR